MKKYVAYIILDNTYQPFVFETDGNAIEYLWTRFGMDTYIDKLEEILGEPEPEEPVTAEGEEDYSETKKGES